MKLRYLMLLILVCSQTMAAEEPKKHEVENQFLKMIAIPRGSEQMKAFYEGRGFPKSALSAVANACFMTVIVKNRSDKILWLELNRWQFKSNTVDIKRLKRSYWKQQWQALEIPVANRSTFGWTLMPESRDLRPDEGVGGNITLEPTALPFEIIASFSTGQDKEGTPIVIKLDKLQCTNQSDSE